MKAQTDPQDALSDPSKPLSVVCPPDAGAATQTALPRAFRTHGAQNERRFGTSNSSDNSKTPLNPHGASPEGEKGFDTNADR